MEHRWGRRQPTDLPVRLVTASPRIGSGRLLNISQTGAFVQTPMVLRIHSVVYLCPAAARVARRKSKGMAACVVRQDGTGFGLEWCEARAEAMSVDKRLKLLEGRGASQLRSPVERQASAARSR